MAVLPVCIVTLVSASIMPSKCEVGPKATAPVTTQTMFSANAPPARVISCPVAILNVPEIWKIQVSVGLPEIVTPALAVTPLVHV